MRLLIVEVCQQWVALPLESVREVSPLGVVTPLPFVPPEVEGLVAVAGRVLPQLCLSTRLGYGRDGSSAGALVLVSDGSSEIALRVARVVRSTEVDASFIVPLAELDNDAAVPHGQVAVVAAVRMDDRLVFVIDPSSLGLAPGQPLAEGGDQLPFGAADHGAHRGPVRADNLLPVLVVAISSERYAIPLDEVEEVYTPESLARVPRAHPAVCGMSVLRGQPLVVLSLGVLLGSVSEPPDERSPLVVVRAGAVRLALQVDRPEGIRRYDRDTDLRPTQGGADVEAYLMGPRGDLCGLLSLASLLGGERSRAWGALLSRAQETVVQSEAVRPVRRCLVLPIAGETCALDVLDIERLVPVQALGGLPHHDHPWLVGVSDVAGQVLPVVDLAGALGGKHSSQGGSTSIWVVLRPEAGGGQRVALVADAPGRLVDIPLDAVERVGDPAGRIVQAVAQVQGRTASVLQPSVLLPATSV